MLWLAVAGPALADSVEWRNALWFDGSRFVPGTRVTVHFEGTIKPNQIKARVVRCQVSAIGSGGSLQYQSAIAFEGRMDIPVDEAVAPPHLRHRHPRPRRSACTTAGSHEVPSLKC
jgi:hypothetical protein